MFFLSGAGVSTASGIPDFRGKHGLYKQFKNAEYYLSIDALLNDTKAFYDFYKNQMILKNVKPNIVHTTLAKWEHTNKIGYVITQNIDGLHSLAGSKKVIELHGSIHRNYCVSCGKQYDLSFIANAKGIPKCSCGGLIRPDVILYGESLKNDVIQECIKALSNTNLLVVAGTRLDVSTASGVFQMFHGQNIVILNNEPTAYDKYAQVVMHEDLAEIFTSLNQL